MKQKFSTNRIVRFLLAPPFVAAFAAVVIMSLALLIHPLIGMADNGDYYRSINGQGLYKLDRYENDQFFNYFSSKYGKYEYFVDSGESIPSTHNLFIQTAIFLDDIFTNDNIFDIRFYSIICIVLGAIGIYMIVDYVTYKKGKKESYLIAAIAVFIFADTAYTAYFNSFYAESVVYVCFLIMIASAFLMTQQRYSPYLLLSLIVVNGFLMIGAKQQNATVGVILFILCLLIAFFFPFEKRLFQWLAIGAGGFLCLVGIVVYIIIPETFVNINQLHSMTRGLLMVADDPEEVLEDFGIDGQYSILNGTIYFEKYPSINVEDEELQNTLYSKYNFVTVASYYLTHPELLYRMLSAAAENGYMIRPVTQGNFEREANREPGEKTRFFTLYSDIKNEVTPKTVGFVFIWIIAVIVFSLKDKPKMMVIICTILIGLIQVGTSIVGAGDTDFSKHIFLYNCSFDVVTYVSFVSLVASFTKTIARNFQGMMQKGGNKL